MEVPITAYGHTGSQVLPCTVYALYNEATGTVIMETVWCDGRNYDMLELDKYELEKFYALLREVVVEFFG
jgi:hypothetical protein